MSTSSTTELEDLIKEQAKELRYGSHSYYERGVALSLDALVGDGKYPASLGSTLHVEDHGEAFLFAPRSPFTRLRASAPSCPIHGLADMSSHATHSPYCNICKSAQRRAKYKAARPVGWEPRKLGDSCTHDWPRFAVPRPGSGILWCTECKKDSWRRTQTSPEAKDRRNTRRRELYAKAKMGHPIQGDWKKEDV